MERFKSLNRYQKSLIIIMVLMTLIFTVLYIKTISKVGLYYFGEILVHSQENGNTVYSGTIEGKQVKYVVSADNSVMFYCGDEAYGPYTVKEDPTIVLEDERLQKIEIRYGDIVMFRGGVLMLGDGESIVVEVSSDGTTLDQTYHHESAFYQEYADEIDKKNNAGKLLPDSRTICRLINNPELTHDGSLFNWFVGVFGCIINVLSIMFADEWFRFGLMFTVRDAEYAEPTDLQIAKRYFSWTIITIVMFICFSVGLMF